MRENLGTGATGYCDSSRKVSSFIRAFEACVFYMPFDEEPQPNCGNYELSEKKKREHIVPILSGRLTLRYQDFSDFDVQIPDKNYRSILFNCRWDLKDSPLWIVKPAGNRAEDFLRRRVQRATSLCPFVLKLSKANDRLPNMRVRQGDRFLTVHLHANLASVHPVQHVAHNRPARLALAGLLT